MKSSKVTNFSEIALWTGLLLLAILSRFLLLTNKPIHFDEGINGWFVLQMSKLGFYKYDPNNYHGPLYFYVLQVFESLWGRSLQVLRAVPAVFSVLSVMIFLYGALRSRFVNIALAVLILISPAFIFFGRSGIHEMPFVFFQIVFALGLLRWVQQADSKALSLFLVGLWGMVTLKETFVVTLFAWVAGFIALGPKALQELFGLSRIRQAWTRSVTVLFLLLLLLFVQLFTGFFKNPSGLLDFFKAILPWLKTGVHGQGHEKNFWYWIQVLYTAEPLALLAVVCSFVGVFSRHRTLRVVSVFSLVQLLVYSLIPYKTVWCVLSLVWGFYFVLALMAEQIFALRSRGRWLFVVAGTGLVLIGFRSTYISVYQVPMDLTHPYVYVNSSYELVELSDRITAALKTHPELSRETVQFGMKEQWPWPWLLRDFKGSAYELCSKRILPDALVYFCEKIDSEPLELLLNESYWKIEAVFRQGKEVSVVYLRKSAFDMSDYKGNLQVVGPSEEDAP
ncbi:TIGR03663 family protein [Bdellovibrio bacteriovorus]|uniref:flippase activity-associated protein Agl23 n=1 Tax=Bdellovibrio bacteriovorus TaxID=959 RepID=UPI0021D1EA20|nr:flippase activity-associated protein Agl23 [Bdellovibrio bacteriovorus]UXR65128.1 TIGR03663 family protein [Bdellovibrio bacteriovorus]